MAQTRIDEIQIKWDQDADGLSCQAIATVSYVCGRNGERRLEWLSSGGLHGIDLQSTPEYLSEIALDELSDLRDHVAMFGLRYSRNEFRTLANL